MKPWDAILTAARPVGERFAAAMADPGAAQRALLQDIVKANAASEFGRAQGFAGISSYEAYAARIPIRTYADHAADIARMANGERGVLTTDPVIAFEETGGTSQGAKLIPYTARSLSGFRDAVLPWLADLARRRPAVMAGEVYASISPATRAAKMTASGLPIGLLSDAAYLGEDLVPAFMELLAISPTLGGIAEVDQWRLETLVQLVANPRLSLISVWSPTFLTSLLPHIGAMADAIAARVDAEARGRLDAALAGGDLNLSRLWPMLDTISCWTDGVSAQFIPALHQMVPHAYIDAKGLLATEAAITTRLGAAPGAVPALLSCVTEYVGQDGIPRLCDTLSEGEAYEVVITTYGGLYRYAMGDVVRCVSIAQGCPRLIFEGRAGVHSDMVGEKLDDAFVAGALAPLSRPAALVPRLNPYPHYALWVEAQGDTLPPLDQLAGQVEAALCANPHYAYARKIGQLGAIDVGVRTDLVGLIIKKGLASGARLGDTKAVGLLINVEGECA